MAKENFISVLVKAGFKKMPWNKCPKGYEKSNYRCYNNEEKNAWCELYLTDKPVRGWIVFEAIKGTMCAPGKQFWDVNELKEILKSL